MTPHYRKSGKILRVIPDKEFSDGLKAGHFVKRDHKGFCVLLWLTAVRKGEALKTVRSQIWLDQKKKALFYEVGERLKHSLKTPPLEFPLDTAFIDELIRVWDKTKPNERIFPYCPKTGYNIVSRVWNYPHLFRLSRITWFFLKGFTVPQIQSWTGLSLMALNYYIAQVDISKMGRAFPKNKGT